MNIRLHNSVAIQCNIAVVMTLILIYHDVLIYATFQIEIFQFLYNTYIQYYIDFLGRSSIPLQSGNNLLPCKMFTNVMAMQFELPNKILLPLLSLIRCNKSLCISKLLISFYSITYRYDVKCTKNLIHCYDGLLRIKMTPGADD